MPSGRWIQKIRARQWPRPVLKPKPPYRRLRFCSGGGIEGIAVLAMLSGTGTCKASFMKCAGGNTARWRLLSDINPKPIGVTMLCRNLNAASVTGDLI